MRFFHLIMLTLVLGGAWTDSVCGREPDVDDAEAIFRVRPGEVLVTEGAAAERPAVESGEGKTEVMNGGGMLPPEYAENVLVVKAGAGAGTGFLCTHRGRLFVATNQHVIKGGKSLEIEGPTGEKFRPLNIIAARNVDIVLIGVLPGAEARRPLVFAENVEEVVTKGDAILVAGNSKGDGVITVTAGTVTGLGPQKLEVDCAVSAGHSGSPIFHVKTREIIGLITEDRVITPEGSVDPGSLKGGPPKLKTEVRRFGHRFDTAENWYVLNAHDFRRHSDLMQKVASEMDAVEAFFHAAEASDWKHVRELQSAVKTAGQVITVEKLSAADRTKAWASLTGTLRSLSSRGVRALEERRPALTCTQIRDLENLGQRSEYLLQLCDILASDMQAASALVSRGRKAGP